MSAADSQAARLLLYEFMETFTGPEMDVAPLAGSDNPTEDLCGRTERFLADGAPVGPLGRERLALEAIKAVTTTCKDAVRGLQRILAITSAAGVKAPYHELLANPSVALIVDADRREWAHLFAMEAPAATDAAEARADTFRGDTLALIASIDALLSLDDAKALVPHPLGGAGSHAYRLLCAARHRLATAEAASATGEREVVEEAVPSPVDDEETRAFIAGWNATRSGTDFDMALHYWMLSRVKLPVAANAKPTSEMLDAAEREGWDRAAAEKIWIAMSLAATPTVTADTRGAA